MDARTTGLVWFVCVVAVSTQSTQRLTIQALKPAGIRILFPEIPGAEVFVFNGNINKLINDYAYGSGDIAANVAVQTDGRVYEDLTVGLQPGDVVHYYYYYVTDQHGDAFHKTGDQSFTVKELVDPDVDIEPVECPETLTQVLNRRVCGNEVIFEDDFTSVGDPWMEKWRMEQYIPGTPDYTFASYHGARSPMNRVSFNGMMRIRPTLLHLTPGADSTSIDAVTGSLNLTEGCTSDLVEECDMQAFGATILPPVVSGRVTSKVAFKYGTVNIRAKLPKGDWLYPDILLESAHAKHGARYFDTGVVRIAGARGNEQLRGGDVEYGNKVLYAGVILDAGTCYNSLLNRTMRKKAWGDVFHLYSLRWTPESMIFLVDGEEWMRLEPASSLQEGLPVECQKTTNSTTKMAPFDDYFRLTLGLAAGGDLEFEDDTVSSNAVKKPWRNGGRKAVFNFWQNQLTWWPTWAQQEGLVVDYVTITAL